MNTSMVCGVVLAFALAVASTAEAGDLGVGVTISGEVVPGVYGRVDLANRPPPPLVYAAPIIIVRPAQRDASEPVYLHVPPGHAKNWSKHCREYNACNRPVYFVKSAEYEPGYQRDHREGRGHHDKGRR